MLREVGLEEMMEARERRVMMQTELLRRYGLPLVCFTMNIPGPVKDSPLIRRGFQAGCRRLEEELGRAGIPVEFRKITEEYTGCTAYYAVRADAVALKTVCTAVEDENALGRLFDMDVLTSDGSKLARETVNGGARNCIVCGAPGRGCASRRSHTVEELQTAVRGILETHFARSDRRKLSFLAARAILDEACVTPKPGLVDRSNSGSHLDMDIFTFTASAAALAPWWTECVKIGQETRALPREETFCRLRTAGRAAEREMFAATGGVNTHKGVIFSLGAVCGAAGRLWRPEGICREPAVILAECAAMVRKAAEADFAAIAESGRRDTVGARLYLDYGLRGIRGELVDGLPSVLEIGLPALENALSAGCSRNDAGAAALLHLIEGVADTNMIARGGMAEAAAAAGEAGDILRRTPLPDMADIKALDDSFIRRNLSPGGCADLLAVTFFLHDLREDGQ